MSRILDTTELTGNVERFLMEINPKLLIMTTASDIVRHEFDCAFFGTLYRDFSTSPLEDAFDVAVCPSDVREHIKTSIRNCLQTTVDGVANPTERLISHFNILWMSPFQVYVEKI